MLKNYNLILNVTSTDFVALFFATLHIELRKIGTVKVPPRKDFFAILATMETLTLQELLGLLCDVEIPLLSLALDEGCYSKIQKEYTALIEHLNNIIENSTGEEA